MGARVDIAILGAGLAGLQLAQRLTGNSVYRPRIALIGPVDERAQRVSFWQPQGIKAIYDNAVQQRWVSWQVRRGNHYHTQCARGHEYVSLDARALKSSLETALAGNIDRYCDLLVADVVVDTEGFRIPTETGDIYARQVIDTRTPHIPLSTLRQQFVGVDITVPQGHGMTCPMLMDFDITPMQEGAVNFVYALPLTPKKLLVEATLLSYLPAPVDAFHTSIGDWLSARLPTGATDLVWGGQEQATLPMGPVIPLAADLVKCGIAGGASRGSTGYAFKGTEAQILALCEQQSRGEILHQVQAYSRRARFMDAVFLEVARKQMSVLPDLFASMARSLSGDTFAQFMGDTGGWMPLLQTVLAAPKRPFINAACRLAWQRH